MGSSSERAERFDVVGWKTPNKAGAAHVAVKASLVAVVTSLGLGLFLVDLASDSILHDLRWRMLNLIVARERPKKRDTTPVAILQFITSTCWKTFYDKETKSLQRSTANENEFFIHEDDPVPSHFISMPRELQGRLNCASFNAGLIRGLLHAAQFPASVRAVFLNNEKNTATTVYVVKFFDKSSAN
ncbi:Trafficking protein particle complex subunit 5 [Hondaea fermentalgiana]|uniref:Trafficking protein particle complex subunit 5 n=1 Tax=Hondaea fermentalgiana TaxID=2315210 RepID=A0A2R5G150_9STRA|nr:Trafficking protein particle complex subunit 5 [Hondaea fermentalgiana]|eukprot:GBG24747.1 Trafficking protein particle complex subunit 5 [Hondaea fermentalgiana]